MTRRKEVKGTRKRRLARLPSAILLDDTISEILQEDINGLTPKFEPTAAEWQSMKKAYDSLKADDREEIVKLVVSYFQSQPFEKSAPFVADKKKWLVKVHKAAEGFHRALLSGEELEDEIERNAAFDVRVRIELHLEKMHCVLSRMDDFENAMRGFLTAAAFVMREVKDGTGKGYVEGESWNKLVIGLAQWFESKDLRVTASKGGIGNPSAFVTFMYELQSTFPERFRRHHHSVGIVSGPWRRQ